MPLLENAVPDRFNLYLWLAAAGLLVLAIDEFRVRPPLGRRALGVTAVGVALVAIVPTLTRSGVVKVPAVVGSSSALRRLVPDARTVLIVPWSDGHVSMYAQARSGFAYDIPDGGVYVPNRDGASYGMHQGPLLYALSALAGQASTQTGRTPEDQRCLAELARRSEPSAGCAAHYRGALRALDINAVVVLDRDGGSEVRRYLSFFGALLAPPVSTSGARVFRVTAAAHA
jgi:hypothetical protein